MKEELPPTTELEESFTNGVTLAKLANFFAPKVVPLRKIYDKDLKRYEVIFSIRMFISFFPSKLNFYYAQLWNLSIVKQTLCYGGRVEQWLGAFGISILNRYFNCCVKMIRV